MFAPKGATATVLETVTALVSASSPRNQVPTNVERSMFKKIDSGKLNYIAFTIIPKLQIFSKSTKPTHMIIR